MLNPIYSYPKIAYGLSQYANEFSLEWADKQSNNQLSNEMVRFMAAKYYLIIQTRYREKNKVMYGYTKPITEKKNKLFKELTAYVDGNK